MKSVLFFAIVIFSTMSVQAQRAAKEDIIKALGPFIDCPAGDFKMGSELSEKGRNKDEKLHPVYVSSFSMQSTEVTQRVWEMIMESNPSEDRTWKDYPVTNVSYSMAMLFIQRLNEATGQLYALPTEAQWEYAAKCGGKSPFIYAGADSAKMVGWYDENSEGRVHVVSELKANDWGFYDLSGNVMEWCTDAYADYRLDEKSQVDPKGADRSKNYVLRGGAWNSKRTECRNAARSFNGKVVDKPTYGFRLVKIKA